MDSPRHRSRLHLACALALAALSLTLIGSAQEITIGSGLAQSVSGANVRGRTWKPIRVKSATEATFTCFVMVNGYNYQVAASPAGTVIWNTTSSWTPFAEITWTGHSQETAPTQGQLQPVSLPVEVRLTSNGPVTSSGAYTIEGGTAQIEWAGNVYGTITVKHPVEFEIVVAPDGTSSFPEPEEEEKLYDKGIIVFDNLTGETKDIAFGDETLQLDPGYNAFPFNGEVDENGFPKAANGEWDMMKTTGPDGQTYWFARQAQNGQWGSEGLSITILPPSSGTSGPVLQIPNGNNPGNIDYVALPAGMTAGASVPLPGGMTAGSPGLPPGVTGGTSGALPTGVISGGTNYLPPGVSAGTTAGNNPTSGGTGGTTTGGGQSTGTGTGGSVGSTTQTPAATEGYLPGASMSGFVEQGKEMGREMGARITEKGVGAAEEVSDAASGFFGEGGFKFWSGDSSGAITGSDGSWANFQLPIAEQMVTIEIPPEWLTIIRSILLWGVKLWFVVACIKLVMK